MTESEWELIAQGSGRQDPPSALLGASRVRFVRISDILAIKVDDYFHRIADAIG